MLDERDAGACRDPAKALEKEIETALEDWTRRYQLVGIELPIAVTQVLLSYTKNQQGFAGYILLMEELADQFALTVGAMHEVLDRDEQQRLEQERAAKNPMH